MRFLLLGDTSSFSGICIIEGISNTEGWLTSIPLLLKLNLEFLLIAGDFCGLPNKVELTI